MANSDEAVILVGHGGIASDTPQELIAELKRLETARKRQGDGDMSEREAELDRQVREWPRTPQNDPYQAGLEAVAEHLRPRLGERRLAIAYNEFCAPSIDQAIDALVAEGAKRITLLTTMFTRGGSHSELDIPAIVAAAGKRHPDVSIAYRWPFDLENVADFLAAHLK